MADKESAEDLPVKGNVPPTLPHADLDRADPDEIPPVILIEGDEKIPPSRVKETALKTAGQRHINLIWEETQKMIALSVTWVALTVAAILAVIGTTDAQTAAFVFLYGVANLVIGFYFGRTNHQKIGGVGDKDYGR